MNYIYIYIYIYINISTYAVAEEFRNRMPHKKLLS